MLRSLLLPAPMAAEISSTGPPGTSRIEPYVHAMPNPRTLATAVLGRRRGGGGRGILGPDGGNGSQAQQQAQRNSALGGLGEAVSSIAARLFVQIGGVLMWYSRIECIQKM